jgi:hypothetical protein
VAVMVNGRKAMCMSCPSEKGRAWTRDGEGRGVRPASAMWGSRSDGGGPGEWHTAGSVTSGGGLGERSSGAWATMAAALGRPKMNSAAFDLLKIFQLIQICNGSKCMLPNWKKIQINMVVKVLV